MNTKLITILSLAVAFQSTSAINPLVDGMTPYVAPESTPMRPAGFTYLSDGQSYAMLSEDHQKVVKYDIRTGNEMETLLDLASTRENTIASIEGFTVSPDGSKLLVWFDSKPIYRRSFTACYYTYELRTRLLRPLSSRFHAQQSPVFSPNGRMVAFVADNNIYIRKLDYQTEVEVTSDGEKNHIINGVPDWVYEEEFEHNCSMTWAPDDLNLCFLKFNETQVPTYNMMEFYGACDGNPAYELYPGVWDYKYPVAGEPNSTVTLHSYDVETRKTKDIVLPDKKIEYIPRIQYGPDAESLIVGTLNRDQNHYEIYRVNPKSTVCKSIYNEDSRSWIPQATYQNITLENDGFVVSSWQSGYMQLYKYTYAGALMRRLTDTQYDITDYYGCDAQGNCYFQAAAPSAIDRTVRKIDRKGIVTTVSPEKGNSSATFAPGCNYMMLSSSNTASAPVYTMATAAGKTIRTLEDNAAYMAKVSPRLCEREFFTFEANGNTLNGYIIRPVGFSASKQYPCLMYQYSGPCSQEVMNRWGFGWQDFFAKNGYVVICIDGRGTGGRGRDFCDTVYKRLGICETADQIAGCRYAASLPFVDSSKIAIFGWSYGGYESLMCATASDSPFAAAVAVAPVTSWRFYDSIYTERYMLTPQQNEDGYRLSSPLNRTAALKCPLLVMYGTADDNVHPANSLEFVSRVEQDGNFCDMLVFPNKNHSIYGCNARAVVYAKMLGWLNKNL